MSVNLILLKKIFTQRSLVKILAKIIFIVGFVGLLFSFGQLETGYEVAKVLWLQGWVAGLMILLWWQVLLYSDQDCDSDQARDPDQTRDPEQTYYLGRTRLKFFSKTINFLFLLLISIFVLTAILGVNRQQSLMGNYYRGDGLLTWILVVILGLLTRFLFDQKTLRNILPKVAIASGLILIAATFFSDWLGKLPIGFGNENITAGFMVVLVPLIVFGLKDYSKIFRGVVLLAVTGTFIQLQAGGAVLSMGLYILMKIWLDKGKYKKGKYKKWVIVLPILFLLLSSILVIFGQPRGNSYFTESRVRVVNKLIRAVRERPLLGWGWANVDVAFESVDWPIAVQHDVYIDKAHSELLEIAVVSGLLGLGTYLVFLAVFYYEVVNSKQIDTQWGKTLFLVCLLYFFHSQTNVVSVGENAVFWLSFGLLLD